MADEPFLSRWSRLRREAERKAEPRPAPEPPPSEEAGPPPDLPPLEDLGPHSDYRLFLRENVPAELRRIALRRAWTSDAAIADFRGFGEYDWDFNAPGYGTPSAADLAAKAGELIEKAAETFEQSAPSSTAAVERDEHAPPEPMNRETLPKPELEPATDTSAAEDAPVLRRRHGGALPD